MSFKLGRASRTRLQGVHPDLVKVVERAIKITEVDFRVGEGLRSIEQQRKNIANGVSWTMRSRHLTGHAVDLWALADGKITWAWPPYHKIAAAMKRTARELKVPLEWGGDWPKKKKDGPHFQLPWDRYPP